MSDADLEDAEVDGGPGLRFRISEISPVPDDDMVAAITAALNEAWPVLTSVAPPPVVPDTAWRFGRRRWHDRQIPRRTWGVRS